MYRRLILIVSLTLSPVVSAQVFDAILDANFDDKPLGQSIGAGGAALGEPDDVGGDRISTEVVNALSDRALRLERRVTESTAAASVRFQFLDNQEVNSGRLRISTVFEPGQLGNFAFRTREAGGSATRWIDLEFDSNGNLRRQVRNEAAAIIGSYAAATPMLLSLEADFDHAPGEGFYEIRVNGALLDSGPFPIVARGVGRILFSFLSGDANFGRFFTVDDVRAEVPSPIIFRDRFQ